MNNQVKELNEIERLNNIINKSIEFILKCSNNGMFELTLDNIEELLHILKDFKGENENR